MDIEFRSYDADFLDGFECDSRSISAANFSALSIYGAEDLLNGSRLSEQIAEFSIPTSGEIFSSTGVIGREIRPFNRLYENRPKYTEDDSMFDEFTQMIECLTSNGEVTRVVMRGIVSDTVLRRILASGASGNIEVAVNLEDFVGENSWLIYLGKNSPERSQIVPITEMINLTEEDRKTITELPAERVQRVLDQGFRFVKDFSKDQVNDILAMWRDTFGWSLEEVNNLRRRLHAGEDGLWFSAVVNPNGEIVAAATAERLELPSQNGPLRIIENTEWFTKPEYRGKGLMTATLDVLNAQIIADHRLLDESSLPLIYAECNFQSRSDRAGHGAGFAIPRRRIDDALVPQLIIQNVNVGDGQIVPEGKLRDFTFMHLTKSTLENDYSPENVEKILTALQI